MTEKQSTESYYSEDTIDLRALIGTLCNYKWIIIGSTLLTALAAFLISNFALPPKYEVSAQIGIRLETFYADFEPSIENPFGLDNYRNLGELTKSLPQLSEANDIELTVCDELELNCNGEQNELPDLNASLLGTNQLKLTVSCETPQLCVEFANKWAEEVIKRWNTIYGNESVDLDQLELEVEDAHNKLEFAQTILESYLPASKANVVEVQLEQAQVELNLSLREIEENNRIIRDAAVLKARLTSLPPDGELSLGDALSIIALQQRITGGISGTQFQLPDGVLLGQDYSVTGALNSIGLLMTSLEEQNQELEKMLPRLENNITDLALDLEKENYQIERLSQERDRARNSYQALARYLDEVTLNLRYQGKSAYLLAKARIPVEESGTSAILVALISAIAIGAIVIISLLFYHWWTDVE